MLASIQNTKSVESDAEVRLEGPPVNGVHIISGAFIHAGIHLRRRVDLQLALHLIGPNAPFVHIHIQMREYLSAIFVPRDVWSRIAFRHAQESNFMAQNVFIVKV